MVAYPKVGGDLSKLWVPSDKQTLFEFAEANGFNRHAIATAWGVSYDWLDNMIRRHCRDEWQDRKKVWDAAEGPESKPSRRFADVLRVDPVKYADPIPYGKPKSAKWNHAVAYGDSHEPFADKKCMKAIRGVIADVRPQLVIHIGDLADCWSISRFEKDPARLHTLQDDIDVAGGHLHQTAQVCRDAKRYLVEGNHEERLRKVIWDLQGAQRELARLRVFQKAMTWPSLLGLDQIGWDFIPTADQPKLGLITKLAVKHGTVVRKWSGWSAKGEYEKHGKGGLSGHTHRLGAFYHRDMAGSHVWHETGCSCDLKPEYVQHPDWQHACVVVAYTEDRYHVEPVYIQDGRAIWRGKEFAA